MANRVKCVETLDDFYLLVEFHNGVKKMYDVGLIIDALPQFRALGYDRELFSGVKIDSDGHWLVWSDDIELEANELWENGIDVV